MDPITHGIVGALMGKAFFAGPDVPAAHAGVLGKAKSAPAARAAIVACTLGAIFPDIDVFAGPLARNDLAIMQWHRNITHSLVMLPAWTLLLAGVSIPLAYLARWKRPGYWKLALIYAAAIASHIVLDTATSFGTMIWSPVNFERVSWDWLFIVDLTLTALALAPQLAAWCYRDPAQFKVRAALVWGACVAAAFGAYALAGAVGYPFPRWVVGVATLIAAALIFVPATEGMGFRWRRASWNRAGFVTACAYMALAAAAHGNALAATEEYAAKHHLRVESIAAMPTPPTLTRWEGVIETPEGVWRTSLREPGGEVVHAEFFASDSRERYAEQARSLRDVQMYLWFARFPVYRIERREGMTVVSISDVRFFRNNPAEPVRPPEGAANAERSARASRERPSPRGFTFEIEFDSAGRVVRDGFAGLEP